LAVGGRGGVGCFLGQQFRKIKRALVERGVPEAEIAFMQDDKKAADKLIRYATELPMTSVATIGTRKKYAAAHQHDAKKGQYGKTRRGGPIPWGDAPALPFIGVSDDAMETKRLPNNI